MKLCYYIFDMFNVIISLLVVRRLLFRLSAGGRRRADEKFKVQLTYNTSLGMLIKCTTSMQVSLFAAESAKSSIFKSYGTQGKFLLTRKAFLNCLFTRQELEFRNWNEPPTAETTKCHVQLLSQEDHAYGLWCTPHLSIFEH